MTDSHLPQLETALDPAAMRSLLAQACLAPKNRFEPRECRIGQVRYKPGRNCLIKYDMLLHDTQRDEPVRQIWTGRMYGPGESASRWSKALCRPSTVVATGPSLCHIVQLGMVVWAFPNERKLDGLQVLFDARRLEEEVLPAALGARAGVLGKPELVRYVPEHGCTVRVRVSLPAGESVLFAKIGSSDDGERTAALIRELGRDAWYSPRHRILWQREVPDRPPVSLATSNRALARWRSCINGSSADFAIGRTRSAASASETRWPCWKAAAIV